MAQSETALGRPTNSCSRGSAAVEAPLATAAVHPLAQRARRASPASRSLGFPRCRTREPSRLLAGITQGGCEQPADHDQRRDAVGSLRPVGMGLALAATVPIWGSSYLLISVALEGLRPLAITFTRVALGLAVGAPVWPAARGRALSASDRPRVALLGVLWLALPLTLYPIAQRHLSSSAAGMITGSQPLMAAADRGGAAPPPARTRSRRRSGCRVRRRRARGLLLRRCRRRRKDRRSGPDSRGRRVLCAGHESGGAAATALRRDRRDQTRVARRVRAARDPRRHCADDQQPNAGKPRGDRPRGRPFSPASGDPTFATLVGRAEATRGAVAIYLVPVVAIALGALFRGEHPGTVALGGAALVTAGAVLVGRSRR